jgi:hypothetical protein
VCMIEEGNAEEGEVTFQKEEEHGAYDQSCI